MKLSVNESRHLDALKAVLKAIGDKEATYKEICLATGKNLASVRKSVLTLIERGNVAVDMNGRIEAGRNIQVFTVLDPNLENNFTKIQVAGIETYAILSGLNFKNILSVLPKCKGDLVDKGWKRP